jgi:hypothetical protein
MFRSMAVPPSSGLSSLRVVVVTLTGLIVSRKLLLRELKISQYDNSSLTISHSLE